MQLVENKDIINNNLIYGLKDLVKKGLENGINSSDIDVANSYKSTYEKAPIKKDEIIK